MKARSAASRARPLTARECVMLDRIGRDRTHKDIAAELGISINTVANLAAKAYRKLEHFQLACRSHPRSS